MVVFFIAAAVVIAFVLSLIALYNTLVKRREMVTNGWADIDVQLKRRADLVPPLVSTVKAYAAHEKTLFEEVSRERTRALAAGDDRAARAAAETALSVPMARLFAVAEAYPDLRASEQFLALQEALLETEDKIEMARRFFNGAVREFNTLVQSFPANILNGVMGFQTATFFN
ncbi:MAG: LemA family protein [Pseudomonadota bacterium]